MEEQYSQAYAEYKDADYSHLPDDPVDCLDGSCVSSNIHLVAPLLLYAVIFLVGIPGNAMVAWVTGKESRHRLWASWFLHLAVADLLCCLALPILAVPIAQKGHWPYGAVGCRLLPSVILLSMYTSVLLLTALSADLCLLASRLPWWDTARRKIGVRVAQVTVWVLALLLTVPTAIHRQLIQEHYPSQLQCVINYGGSVTAEASVTAVRFLFGFLGPLVFMASCHGVLQCWMGQRHWPLGTAIMVGFFICWTPYHVLGVVITVAAPHSPLLARALQAEPLVVGLALAHSSLNPIIFLYFGRGQLRKSLRAACHWALREPQNEESITKTPTSHEIISEMEL
ncbi:C5a anaphylatoxin chemotactic receptor 2 isoform X2 [Nannospalax galili]|uniref:C5a anaphylatoxin chemotactic receptor 2 n=2 Tax=Nannospalax galili TaxID=1026970 RepID=A0A8C6QQT0_NANGA|nr:C5a anaphylatoxin chemotactic receptor 2 isoform X2 [Nannospalax galili]XP_029414027.1 C5a anaphylatoxin chemotactic receptor 2 isoform X2 [Nannospalax galili]XP_029414031.1 C5a anaphylatoxin chemotactic receptor 2 isoform X2 [Nannospalax galili]XP_029414034.1 C5a anaphylatoxin chemotactic receptor 2 isoform X2 [Nannospalax galili]XP_029414036.1 C5a anaphylatoxin chemotactic receptor 2 isoform X2 [Nannospalax galili]